MLIEMMFVHIRHIVICYNYSWEENPLTPLHSQFIVSPNGLS
jgi:hypothetical protein